LRQTSGLACLLPPLVGQQLRVDLLGGGRVQGRLEEFDSSLGVLLAEAVAQPEDARPSQAQPLGLVRVRGSRVRLIRLPESFDTAAAVQQAAESSAVSGQPGRRREAKPDIDRLLAEAGAAELAAAAADQRLLSRMTFGQREALRRKLRSATDGQHFAEFAAAAAAAVKADGEREDKENFRREAETAEHEADESGPAQADR
ncbi:hypothetical protein BOX15_Mlig030926g3, partial [Macrostomum lignano]